MSSNIGSSGSSTTAGLTYPDPIIIPSKKKQKATLIMLHGLGDTGHGWSDLASQLSETLPHVKFIFPTAPNRSITINMGMKMPGWFDINSLEKVSFNEDSDGIYESVKYIDNLIDIEIQNDIRPSNIAIGGFSQGGVIAIMFLRSSRKFAAIFGLSTYLPLRYESLLVSGANRNTPLLMCHGTSDPIINYEIGKESYALIKDQLKISEFKSYANMGHSACLEEINDIRIFLETYLNSD